MATDDDALTELARVSDCKTEHLVQHYLYFPRQNDAKTAAGLLRKNGFDVEERLGADDVNWLVLAKSKIVPTTEAIAAIPGTGIAIREAEIISDFSRCWQG